MNTPPTVWISRGGPEMSLIAELKRRNVFRVGVAYAIVAWLLIEVASVILPALHLPDWALTLLVVLVVAGFPLALIMAWAFELTPEGIKREEEVDRSSSQPRRRRNTPIIGLLILAVAFFLLGRFVWTEGDSALGVDRRSVAVIPFENLSGDEANVPFTSGIHDDLLTQLSKISSIKTISRRSVLQYRDTAKTVREIAAELGVATILAGGVQRSGDRVRINVRLIDAATDEPLWAETYDRQLSAANIFAIQSEIAVSIAEALRAKLTAGEQQRLAAIPTRNLEALDTYFLGKQLLEERNIRALQAAVEYFEQVIKLDPDFALAWSGLADAYMILPEYSTAVDLELVQEKSVAAAARALELDPEIPEVLASMAWNRLIHDYDWAEAEALLRRAIEIQSNNTSALHWLSHVLSWQGEHAEALQWANRAVEVDPLSTLMYMNLSYIYMDAGDFEESIRIANEAWERDPHYGESMGNLFLTYLRAERPADAAKAMKLWAASTGRDVEAVDQIGRLFIRHHQGESIRLSSDLLERAGSSWRTGARSTRFSRMPKTRSQHWTELSASDPVPGTC